MENPTPPTENVSEELNEAATREAEAALAEAEAKKAEKRQAQELAAIELQKIEDAKPEAQVALPTHKRKLITSRAFDDYDFDPKYNVRDINMYGSRVREKVAALLEDKLIRTPLVACEMRGSEEGAKPRGACGFLRWHALKFIKDNHSDVYRDHFKTIPVLVYENCTERDRELLMLDHGLETGLTEYEVVLTVRRLDRTGQYTEKAMARALHKSLLAIAGAKAKATYDERNNILLKEGVYIDDKGKKFTNWADLVGDFWRGRIQRYKRLNDADKINPRVLEEYKKFCEGGKNAINFTSQQCVKMPSMTKEELDELIDRLIAEKTGVKPKEKSKVWSQATMERVEKANRSEFLGVQLKAALGDETAQAQVNDVEDKLVTIEKAIKYDPNKFWQTVNEIIAIGPPAAPAPEPTPDPAPEVEEEVEEN